MQNILITGGAGYIGSHICIKLQENGYQPIVFDNLSNGHRDAISNDIPFVEGDIRDAAALNKVFEDFRPAAVIHMAALIEAGASMVEPARFYEVNTAGALNLLEAMRRNACKHIVFSSTAAVYGNRDAGLLSESLEVSAENPYGRSKAMVETMLGDYASIYGFHAIALRYFNAAGADSMGRTGERHDPETHLIPLVLQTAAGQRDHIKIFGTDYDTPDGTCIRDYIHVDDLADAHVKALGHIISSDHAASDIANIGTGEGCSVKEIIELCKEVTGQDFTVVEDSRRPGDPAKLVANPAKAKEMLGWQPKYPSPRQIIEHAWNYYQTNLLKS
ncbi:UDP-glucose 4-epimerase GalE [Thalassospira sp.]|uniref:UDP-glucose 4-epimerase GalE n=1 Tax=Thalassospira sp. TaxID=1912094 RepID=UPI000C6B0FB8|nr:UDP-glucose 4-epimerase GalE [Thalassospira sp.]MBC07421.1 UDP-glucose 4-epimerase GalE [Thalassospira sp.]|tara:strand:+ start:881 stop:1873 length:993 start_codon:yes stop_codon:yes gene_type:complete